MTDVELRYGGKPAAFLRGFRSIYIALRVNSIIVGWVTATMLNVLKFTVFSGTEVGSGASDWFIILILFAIVSLAASPNENQLKALAATAASSGSVGLFHIVGVTPEAPTVEDALPGKTPEYTDPASGVNTKGYLVLETSGRLRRSSRPTPIFRFDPYAVHHFSRLRREKCPP